MLRTAVIGLLLLAALGVPAVCGEVDCSWEQFPFKSTGAPSGDGAWKMNRNGYIGTFVVLSEACRVTFSVSAEGQGAVMHIHVGRNKYVHDVRGGDYRDYRFTCNLPPGTHAVRLELTSAKPGRESLLRIKRLRILGAGVQPADTSDMDALVLKAADTYVENYRKGDFEITVTGADSKPLPSGKPVHIKLRKHAFDFGTALYGTNFQNGDWLRDRPEDGSDAYNYQEFVKSHFNTVVPENAGKWASCEAERDVETMEFIDAMMGFAKKNGLAARMHCVLWGQSMPKWGDVLLKTAAESGDAIKREAAANELRKEITERINCLVKDRAGSYAELDGINESMHQDGFLKAYGASGVAAIYDEILDASAGRARVYFNEFNLFQWVHEFGYKDDYANWYTDHIERIINSGISPKNRANIGIGMQYYPGDDENARKFSPHSPARISQILHAFSVFEYPMTLTEFGTGDKYKAGAPRMMSDIMRLVFGNDQTTGFLLWGFWHRHMWAAGSALVDDDWKITECGKTYEQLLGIRDWGIKDLPVWSTDIEAKTTKGGKVNFRGFYGEYEVTADGKTQRIFVGPGGTGVRP